MRCWRRTRTPTATSTTCGPSSLPGPAGPDSVALHLDLEADDGVRPQEATAVERVAGQPVVLHAATLADFDLDDFVRLTATAKARTTLG
ncbi:MAG: hypothetical protein ACRDSK_09790 [Actinophytocola sp.]|uniref:hypothetical protein n=1 Tax=Actinophytocola sp. TaxID=1872138 RepID=UPI003D6C2A87